MVRLLRRKGHEVFIVTYGEKCDLSECAEFRKNLTYVSYKCRFSWIDSVIFNAIPRMVNAARITCKIACDNNIDIVIASSIHEAGGLSLFNISCPIAAVCHGYYPYELRQWNDGKRKYLRLFIYWLLEKLGKNKVKSIVCPSEWLKCSLKNRLKHKEIVVISNMLRETPGIQEGFSRMQLGLKNDKPVIISYNMMTAPFYYDSFRMYQEVVKKVLVANSEVQFLLFGITNSAFEFAAESIKGLPVKVLGKVENVFELLSLADIYLHISLIDSFSLMTLEAMSVGLPVVATSNGALPERIENERTGLLRKYDSCEIASGILDLLDDAKKREKLGEQARAVSREFSEDNIGQVWDSFLAEKVGAAAK